MSQKLKKFTKISKNILMLLVVSFTGILLATNIVLAQGSNDIPATESLLIPQITPINEFGGQGKAIYVKGISTNDAEWQVLLTSIIRIILSISSTLAFIAMTVGGIMMLAAQGDEGRISKGKNILYMSVIALAIMALAFALVTGVSQLKIF